MSRNLIIAVVAVTIIVVGAAFVVKNSPSQNRTSQGETQTSQPTQESKPNATDSETTQNVREFTVTGSPFKFDIKEIRVKKGEKVKIVFKNSAGTHNLTIDGLNVGTPEIQAGQETAVEFTADKAGTFEYYCSVGNHREMGMVGTLVVE